MKLEQGEESIRRHWSPIPWSAAAVSRGWPASAATPIATGVVNQIDLPLRNALAEHPHAAAIRSCFQPFEREATRRRIEADGSGGTDPSMGVGDGAAR